MLARVAELSIPATGDVRIERVIGKPVIDAHPDRARMARYGVKLEDAFLAIAAYREPIRDE